MAPAPEEYDFENARTRLQRRVNGFVGVTAVDVGYRWKNNRPTDEICLRVHVDRKVACADMSAEEVIPKNFEGIAVDVITASYCAHLQDVENGQPGRPYLLSGSACSRLDARGGGTVGAIVMDNRTGAPGILSNWHVISGPNGARGDRIVSRNAGVTRNIGTLVRGALGPWGDAAFARIDGPAAWLPAVRELSITVSGARKSRLGEELVKYGRATGLTRARVDGEGVYRVRYLTAQGQSEVREIRGFKLVPLSTQGQGASRISAPGDSGSLWIDPASGQAVGLNFAGEEDGNVGGNERMNFALACEMVSVLDHLDVRLATLDDVIDGATRRVSPPPRIPLQLVPVASNQTMAPFSEPDRITLLETERKPVSVAAPSPLCDPRDFLVPAQEWTDHGLNQDPRSRPIARAGYDVIISVRRDIWPEFEGCCRKAFPTLRGIALQPETDFRRVIGKGPVAVALRDVIGHSVRFGPDGAIPHLADLVQAQSFLDVCQSIGRVYRTLGHTLRA
ncbi:S1 family peptidase [Seohaeicola saemankumensis]|nr:S1 family peptidase [Seohaeicola saemankumensis]MCA0869805.1 S1 family peptidase [Seohaeicola saemankumensis]